MTLHTWRGSPYLLAALFILSHRSRSQSNDSGRRNESATSNAQVLDENQFFRADRLQLGPGISNTVAGSTYDAILIAISGAHLTVTENRTEHLLSEGDVDFISRSDHATLSNGEGPAEVVVARLKRHFDAEVKPCLQPRPCTRPIQMGTGQIGQSTLLFSSGFITAYRHHLDRGGTLASSYYSSNGKDHLLLVALTKLEASFDGEEEHLSEGQVYTSDASQVEVNARDAEARWVVIRMEVPQQGD